jgi:hypothetical protein
MKAAYSYRRWSSKAQGADGRDSRRRQAESAQKWIVEHGKGEYHLAKEVFEDAGKSGFKGKHVEVDDFGKAKGELMRFIQLYEQAKIAKGSILLIDSVDRFGRMEVPKQLSLFLSMVNAGIGIVFTSLTDKRVITNELLTKEPYVLYVIIGEIIRSYKESEEKSRKVKESKARKKKLIQAGVIVPHNLMPKYFTFVPIANGTGKYIHNENTAIVKELIAGILAGKSLYEMTIDLNKRKVKTFRWGNKWHPCSVRQILRNPVLKGEWQGVQEYVTPIIDSVAFQKVQNVLKQNQFSRGKKAEHVNIFKSICVCGKCNKAMNVTGGGGYRYLRCSNYYDNDSPECKHNYIRLEPMEYDFVLKFLAQDPWKLVNPEDNGEITEINDEITKKTAHVNAIGEDIEKIMALVTDADMKDMPEIKDRLSKLGKQREVVRGELDELNYELSQLQDVPEDGAELYYKLFPLSQRKSGKTIVREIELEDNGRHKVVSEVKTLSKENLKSFITDNSWREKLRLMLPNLIGKIVVYDQKFKVYNRMGKQVFQSVSYESMRNNSESWRNKVREGIKTYWENKKAKDERKKSK